VTSSDPDRWSGGGVALALAVATTGRGITTRRVREPATVMSCTVRDKGPSMAEPVVQRTHPHHTDALAGSRLDTTTGHVQQWRDSSVTADNR
jgi:hypothetical protein